MMEHFQVTLDKTRTRSQGKLFQASREGCQRLPGCPERRAAFPFWEAEAVDQHQIDIAGAGGDALGQQQGSFVGHGQQHALDYIVTAELAAFETLASGLLHDQLGDARVLAAVALLVVEIVAGAGLATEMPLLA
ncbi:hypothetical protein D3C84_926900 [compost metagenome]